MTNPKYLAKDLNKRFAESDDGKAILHAYIDVGANAVINDFLGKYSSLLITKKLLKKVVNRIDTFVQYSERVEKVSFRTHLMDGFHAIMVHHKVPAQVVIEVLDYTKVSNN